MSSIARPSGAGRIAGGLLLLCGLALGGGGAWLAALGGSWYYLPAGLALAASGVLLMRRSPAALWLYAALLAVTLLWALWETGLDWWPLAARLGVLFVLGLVLLTPWVARAVRPPEAGRDGYSKPAPLAARKALALVAALAGMVAVAALAHDPHRIEGAFAASPAAPQTGGAPAIPADEWHAYGRTGFGQRYTPLTQITPANVARLRPAWQFRTGDMRGQPGDPTETTFEVTPLKLGNRLFLCTPHQNVIALDATTGAEVWRYNPQIKGQMALQHLTCRGLSFAPPAGEAASAGAPCAGKLFMPTADGRVIALDPASGAVCPGFGVNGAIDLWANMPNVRPGAYYSTSPVVVTSKYLIVGGTVLDNVSTREQSGVIRAYDVNTGALVWNWDSARPDATTPIAADGKYTPNSPNSWSISSVDEALGLVYIPMGNQPPDQWGGRRTPEVERYSSSVVALELETGKVRWSFQTVHHDLWDYDVPSQPSLLNLTLNGVDVPALVQATKQGELFVLDRRSGTPLLPVTEQLAPQGAAAGDRTAPTQPRSGLSFDPPPLRGRDMWGLTLFDQLYCRIALKRLRYEGRYTPPSVQGSLIYPGNFGVFNWGGVAVDPVRQVVFATPAYLAFTSRLIPRRDDKELLVQDQGPPHGMLPALNENVGAPFAVKLGPFVSPLGIPCQTPPWGYVAGADLRSGKVVWQHRNGTVRDLSPLPLPIPMGVPSLGGPIMTGGGVAFLSGTLDNYVRAYDVRDGRQLWEQRLPAGGQATPMSYMGEDGRQYVLVAAGGHGSTGTTPGDYVIAYALSKP